MDEVVYDKIGKIVLMAKSGGDVMVRRPGCMPFVMKKRHYYMLPRTPAEGEDYVMYNGEVRRVG